MGFMTDDNEWQKFSTEDSESTVFETRLGNHENIIGLEQTVLSMSKGEVVRVFIPSRLAYGEHGGEPLVPPNTDLLFELELVDIRNNSNSDDDDEEEEESDIDAEDIEDEAVDSYFSTFKIAIISFFSFLYEYVEDYIYYNGFNLHLVGIGRPEKYETSEIVLFNHINTENTLISIKTPLTATSTVGDLKKYIKGIYKIEERALLVLLCHHLLTDNEAKLGDVGVSNNSLLTLAVCDANRCQVGPPPVIVEEVVVECVAEPVSDVNELFEMYDSESDVDMDVYSDSDDESVIEYESSEDHADAVNSMFEMYEDYESEPEPFINEFICVANGEIAIEEEPEIEEEKEEQ